MSYENQDGSAQSEVCAGVGKRVPYYEVKGGRTKCPVCGTDVPVVDDGDGSMFTIREEHRDTRKVL